MIRNIGPSAERFLADLGRIQEAAERAQREISSGVRIAAASDAPEQLSGLLQLYASVEKNVQIRANLNRVKTEVDTAERSVALAVQVVERAAVLASKGAGTIETAQSRRILAEEVRGLLEEMVAISRTRVEDRYIFSGDRDGEPPYELTLTNPSGVTRMFTALATRRIEHPNGGTFQPARTAEEIFDLRNADGTPAAGNAFAALNGLRAALENDDQTAIDAALAALRAAAGHLNIQLSFYGNVQRKVAEAVEGASKLELQLRLELSAKRDADLTASALELQRARTHEEAALQARARLPNTSLFDFLG